MKCKSGSSSPLNLPLCFSLVQSTCQLTLKGASFQFIVGACSLQLVGSWCWLQKTVNLLISCLSRKPTERPNCKELLTHPFVEVTREELIRLPWSRFYPRQKPGNCFFFVYSEYVYCDNRFELKANHRNLIITRDRLYLQYIGQLLRRLENHNGWGFCSRMRTVVLFRRHFCNEAKLRCAGVDSGRHISDRFLCHCLALWEQVFILKPNSF